VTRLASQVNGSSEVDGIVYRTEGDGPPVVLLHSGVADSAMWDEVAAALAPAHTVIRYDRRGFGASPPPRADYSPLDDLLAVLDACAVRRAAVAGSSAGGKLALDLAGARPERVSRLVLLAPPIGGWAWSDAMRAYAAAEAEALAAGDLDAAVRLNLDMWVRGPARPWSPPLYALADRIREPLRVALTNQETTEEHEREDDGPPVEDRLAALALPTVVGIGDRDQPDFIGIARRLAAEIPDAELVDFPDAGHLLPLERPEQVAALLANPKYQG
jgi:3-oxoadipate enol-lactonase